MLYHKKIFWPLFTLPKVERLIPTFHAQKAAMLEKYGSFELPEKVNVTMKDVFEVELIQGKVTKFACRLEYDNEFDICLVIAPFEGIGRIVTAWLNKKNDTHSSLRQGIYERG